MEGMHGNRALLLLLLFGFFFISSRLSANIHNFFQCFYDAIGAHLSAGLRPCCAEDEHIADARWKIIPAQENDAATAAAATMYVVNKIQSHKCEPISC